MQIIKADVTPVELHLNQPVRMAGYPEINHVNTVFVRLQTQEGRDAWGCAVISPDLTDKEIDAVLSACQQGADLAPDLNPINLEHSLARLTYEIDEVPAALCAFDLAFHDLLGVVAGIPLHRILGGYRNKIMTSATVYLGTVVTDAVLESDPALSPRHFIDNYCEKCRACAQSCVARMFIDEEEEYVLLNDELHPRGKRRDVWFCNASCFGLHSLSEDKKWSSWGQHWMGSWVHRGLPDPEKHRVREDVMKKGAAVGDSTVRYWTIRRIAYKLHPDDYLETDKLISLEIISVFIYQLLVFLGKP